MNRTTRIELGDLANPEPVLLGKKLNRRLSVQNNQLNSKWARVQDSLDRIKGLAATKMERDKNEMLKYQQKLKANSGNFSYISETSTANTPRSRAMGSSVAQDEAMKHTWLEKSEKSQQRRFSMSGDTLVQSSTISSDKKRVFRRQASLSLLEFQKINGEGSSLKPRVVELSKTFLNSLEEEPSKRRESIFEGEEVEPIRIPPSVRFPPIHQLQPTKLSTRNFEKDADFERRRSGELNNMEDLKYCRYIRNGRRKSVA